MNEDILIEQLEAEIEYLNRQLNEKKKLLQELKNKQKCMVGVVDKLIDIPRYSRQIILPSVGLNGQKKLSESSVLIVGCGGLGCPAAIYLCSAGIGHIGLVDYDNVEINNLHRQILHSENDVGSFKVDSACRKLQRLNSTIKLTPYKSLLNSDNAISIISDYDVVIDATDNVATRYLLNDACVFSNKPLVSGSALKMEGQLIIYNHLNSPCYRCVFPQPPPPNAVNNCGDSGVFGPICGVIGVLQALETIKLILNADDTLSGRMLLFNGCDSTFRVVNIRKKKIDCDVCGEKATIKKLIDYEQFCGSAANDKGMPVLVLSENERISVEELNSLRNSGDPHILIDVRSSPEFDMCHLTNSLNIHINNIDDQIGYIKNKIVNCTDFQKANMKIITICRRGNDSQIAVKKLKEKLNITSIFDVKGGLHQWAANIDKQFPVY